MDIGTIAGLLVGFILIIIAIFLGGSLGAFVNIPSILIVVGGSLATCFIRFTLSDVINSISVAMNAFFAKSQSSEGTG